MPLTSDDVDRLADARVVDAKGEKIGWIDRPHVLKGTLVGVHVRLDDVLAGLPTVARDDLEVAPDFLDEQGDGSVAMCMDFMDAVTGHAVPRARGGLGRVLANEAPPVGEREWAVEPGVREE